MTTPNNIARRRSHGSFESQLIFSQASNAVANISTITSPPGISETDRQQNLDANHSVIKAATRIKLFLKSILILDPVCGATLMTGRRPYLILFDALFRGGF
jgi:hypothetical protein